MSQKDIPLFIVYGFELLFSGDYQAMPLSLVSDERRSESRSPTCAIKKAIHESDAGLGPVLLVPAGLPTRKQPAGFPPLFLRPLSLVFRRAEE